MRTDFVVIGAGLCGLSAAWALARRGYEVTVLDQAPTGHVDGGSHGSCRVFRLGYETVDYVRLAQRARELWTELEEEAGEQLLHPTPQLTFGPEVHLVKGCLDQAGAPGELLSDHDAAERFPGIAVPGPVLCESQSAVIAADRVLAALARLSGSAERVPVRATGLTTRAGGLRVSTTEGELDAARVIVCAGPWTPRLAAGAGIAVPSIPTMQQVCYLDPAGDLAAASTMPIFVHYGDDFPYGLPVPGSARYKISLHSPGPAIDPDHQDHSGNAGLIRRLTEVATAFLPGFQPDPVAVERCVYDNSPDGDFIVDRVGDLVVGSGTSGHGFKFGPLIGEWLAALATDDRRAQADRPPSWMSLSRLS